MDPPKDASNIKFVCFYFLVEREISIKIVAYMLFSTGEKNKLLFSYLYLIGLYTMTNQMHIRSLWKNLMPAYVTMTGR